MNMTKMSVLLMACLLTFGCGPSQQELAIADYGSMPIDYQEQITNHMTKLLKDPYSAKYRFEESEKCHYYRGVINGGGHEFGWCIITWINAKNSYGGYTGEKRYKFFFVDGKLKGELLFE